MTKLSLLVLATALTFLSSNETRASTVLLDGKGELGEISTSQDTGGVGFLIVEDGFSFHNCSYYCGDWGDDLITLAATSRPEETLISSTSGKSFDLITANISAGSNLWRSGPGERPECDNGDSCPEYYNWAYYEALTYLNLAVLGYRDGLLVATDFLSLEGTATLNFQPEFRNLDALVFVAQLPNAPILYNGPTGPNQVYCDRWNSDYACALVRIKAITLGVRDGDLAALPLPASLPLAVAGLGLLWATGQRRRKRRT